MQQGEIQKALVRANAMLSEVEDLVRKLDAARGPLSYEEVTALVDPISEKIEDATHVLIEAEVDGLPDAEPSEDGELPEADEKSEGFQVQVRKQEIEDRARRLEARLFRRAADLAGPALSQPGQLNEAQNEMLSNAATALESAFSTRPDPATAVELAEVRLLQLEIEKARQALDVAAKLDAEGPHGKRAAELLQRIATDPALKARSRCFIATAACGSDSGEVATLRRFRDRVLENSDFGRAFVRSYYRVSPPIALLVESSPRLASVVRTAVVGPLARVASYVLKRRG